MCHSLENRFGEAAARQAASLDRLSERQERVSQDVQALKLDDKNQTGQVQIAIERVKDLESSLAVTEGETREMLLKERQMRQQAMERTQTQLVSEQTKQISDLEKKIADRLEKESGERERNMSEIM